MKRSLVQVAGKGISQGLHVFMMLVGLRPSAEEAAAHAKARACCSPEASRIPADADQCKSIDAEACPPVRRAAQQTT